MNASLTLHYATMLLVERGWTVHQVWWDEGEQTSVEAAVTRARHELDAVTAPVHLVIAIPQVLRQSVSLVALLTAVGTVVAEALIAPDTQEWPLTLVATCVMALPGFA